MTSRFYLTIVIFAICVIELWARPSSVPCPQSQIPDGSLRGVNTIEGGKSRYWIDVGEARRGYVPNRTYTFLVGAQDSKYPFDDVVLTASSSDDTCASGQFSAMDNQYQPLNCPDVISTEQKKSMDHVPFQWTAPNCGCIHVRGTVISNGVYYQEVEKQISGDLAKIVCPQKAETSKQNNSMETLLNPQIGDYMVSRNQKFQLLCGLIGNYSSVDLTRQHAFFLRRGMEESESSQLSEFEHKQLQTMMDHRRLNVAKCCHFSDIQQTECFGDIRRHRIDRFCADGVPDIPFTKIRKTWMRDREDDCCWRLGEERYKCFNYTNYNSERPKEFTEGGVYTAQSMDEFDPVHDIEDYPTHVDMSETTDAKVFQTSNETTTTARNEKSKENHAVEEAITEDTTISTDNKRVEQSRNETVTDKSTGDSEEESNIGTSEEEDDDDKLEYLESESIKKWKQELKDRAEKSQLKLHCCTEGEILGFTISKSIKAYRECPKVSRQFSNNMKSRRQMCRTSFLQCCLEAGISRAGEPSSYETATSHDETPSTQNKLRTEIKMSTLPSFIGGLGQTEKDPAKSAGQRMNKKKKNDDDVDNEDQLNERTTKRNRSKSLRFRLRKEDVEKSENKESHRHRKRHRSRSPLRRNGDNRDKED